jgi:uncharacterized membrane protein
MNYDKQKILRLARGAMLAAIYAALTVALAPVSFGAIQFRISEAMTVLPWLYPEAVPGVFAGCLIANLIAGNGLPDVVFGSLATLLAAMLSRRVRNKWLVPLPPVIINALVVGAVLSYVLGLPLWITVAEVGLGQLGACYALGMPLLIFMERFNRSESVF